MFILLPIVHYEQKEKEFEISSTKKLYFAMIAPRYNNKTLTNNK